MSLVQSATLSHYVYVCIYACMCVRSFVCMPACMNVLMDVLMYECTQVCKFTIDYIIKYKKKPYAALATVIIYTNKKYTKHTHMYI